MRRGLTAVIAALLTPAAISLVQKAAQAGHAEQAVAAAVLAAAAAFTVGWILAQFGVTHRGYSDPRSRWGGGWR